MGIKLGNITLFNVLYGVQNIFNHVDNRLVDHGERVAYLMFKMLKSKGTYTDREIAELTALASIHDVGAYKTDNIDKLIEFEVDKNQCYKHSVYGYLYIKHFSPFSHMANMIYYHHGHYDDVKECKEKYVDEALMLHLADRVDILLASKRNIDISNLYKYGDKIFNKKHIDLLVKVDKEENILKNIKSGKYRKELYGFWSRFATTEEENTKVLEMIVFILDFRSSCTVNHSITVAIITKLICDRLDIDNESIVLIEVAAMLHDIGKVSTPLSILEKPGKLNDDEMAIMKNHVVVTKSMLKKVGLDRIANLAGSHHEKIDGTGYPEGLKGDELSLGARILCIADIVGALAGVRSYKVAFTKEKIISIISEMATENKIDKDISNLFINDYDEIMSELKERLQRFEEKYDCILEEYDELMGMLKQ